MTLPERVEDGAHVGQLRRTRVLVELRDLLVEFLVESLATLRPRRFVCLRLVPVLPDHSRDVVANEFVELSHDS